MSVNSTKTAFAATILIRYPAAARLLAEKLEYAGASVSFQSDANEFLRQAQAKGPDLVIVDEHLDGISGSSVLANLLRISWTTATILITEEPEDIVHERTEGLGILGSIKDYRDVGKLEELVKTFLEMRRQNS